MLIALIAVAYMITLQCVIFPSTIRYYMRGRIVGTGLFVAVQMVFSRFNGPEHISFVMINFWAGWWGAYTIASFRCSFDNHTSSR
jgi:hypothetical protein